MKLIQLTKGQFAQVDDEDFEYLNQFKWQALSSGKNNTYYAAHSVVFKDEAGNKKWKKVLMHRLIMKVGDRDIQVDHWDRNKLNNQKHNLREATQSQNTTNCAKKTGKSSQYIGVSFHRRNVRWTAQIKINGKMEYLGSFENEIDAAKTFDNAAKIHHKEFAVLNFK